MTHSSHELDRTSEVSEGLRHYITSRQFTELAFDNRHESFSMCSDVNSISELNRVSDISRHFYGLSSDHFLYTSFFLLPEGGIEPTPPSMSAPK